MFQKPYGFFRRNWPDVELSTATGRRQQHMPRNSAGRPAFCAATNYRRTVATKTYESPQSKPVAGSNTGPVNIGCSMARYRSEPLFPFKNTADSLILERSGTGAGLQPSPFSTTFSVSFRDPH